MDIKTAEQCAEYIKDKINGFKPTVGVVLGSGLGEVFGRYRPEKIIEYSEIPQFPTATVSGHKGRFLFFNLNGKNVMVMQGRVHFYEGYSISQTVLPIAVMKILGVQSLILTNASGGINPSFNPGDIMVITDHISSFVPSPLIGKNNDKYGTRFPDMSNVYNSELVDIIYKIADEMDIRLKKRRICTGNGAKLRNTGRGAYVWNTRCRRRRYEHRMRGYGSKLLGYEHMRLQLGY